MISVPGLQGSKAGPAPPRSTLWLRHYFAKQSVSIVPARPRQNGFQFYVKHVVYFLCLYQKKSQEQEESGNRPENERQRDTNTAPGKHRGRKRQGHKIEDGDEASEGAKHVSQGGTGFVKGDRNAWTVSDLDNFDTIPCLTALGSAGGRRRL